MATRARAERGGPSVKEQFEGRVRKWVKKWSPVSDKKLAKVQLLKWVQLEEKTGPTFAPRHPQYKPVPKDQPLPLELILPSNRIVKPASTPPPLPVPVPASATATVATTPAVTFVQRVQQPMAVVGLSHLQGQAQAAAPSIIIQHQPITATISQQQPTTGMTLAATASVPMAAAAAATAAAVAPTIVPMPTMGASMVPTAALQPQPQLQPHQQQQPQQPQQPQQQQQQPPAAGSQPTPMQT